MNAREARVRGQPAALAFIKNAAHPSTGRCHRFRDRRFGAGCRRKDMAGGTRPFGRVSDAGRSTEGRARYVQNAAVLGRMPAEGGRTQHCHFLAVRGHDVHRPTNRAGLAPWHGATYLRNGAMGPSWSSDGRLFNANT